MFTNRFLLVLGVLSLLLVTMAVSRPFSNAPTSAELSWPPRPVMMPVTGANDLSDYYERHPEMSTSAGITIEMSDYFVRHPELLTPTGLIDLSDYFLRH